MTFQPIQSMTNMQLIHVGKCAGGSLRRILDLNSIPYTPHHAGDPQPTYNANHKYVITVRDPVDRIVSALNWRRYLLASNKRQGKHEARQIKLELELSLLLRIKNVEHFAELICQNNGDAELFFQLIGHLRRGLYWYCENLFLHLNSAQVIGIIRTNFFESDIKQQLKLQNCQNIKDKSNYPKFFGQPSQDARRILKNYLTKDYECLVHLEKIRTARLQRLEANI